MNAMKRAVELPPFLADGLPPHVAAEFIAYLDEQLQARVSHATKTLLVANYGPVVGAAVHGDLFGTLTASNAEFAGTKSRAVVSKIATRLRRGLNLPVREPAKRRGGGWAARRAKAAAARNTGEGV